MRSTHMTVLSTSFFYAYRRIQYFMGPMQRKVVRIKFVKKDVYHKLLQRTHTIF